jgi:hypothetical protein
MFYVYEHIRLGTNTVFYVGKGKGRRCFEARRRNQHWKHVVAKAGGFDVRIVVDKIDEELAFLAEQELITKLKLQGASLANLTDGGEGASGYRHTDNAKIQLSKIMSRTMEAYKHIARERQLGENNSAKKLGVGDKISKALRGRKLSSERKAKSSLPRGKNPKAVKVSLDGKQFDCIKDMAEVLGMSYTTLVNKMRRMKKYDWTTEDMAPVNAAIAAGRA